MKRFLLVFLAVLLPAAPAFAAPPDQADGIEHFTRDVKVIIGSTLREPDPATTDPDAPLFNVAGVNLGLTWGQWSAATATSRAQANDRRTDVRLAFTGLVPNGLYTLFWGTLGPDSEQPLCPAVERTLPLDATKPADPAAPNAFRARADGTAEFRGEAPGTLLDAYQVFFSVVYRFTDETTYPFPNKGELLTQGENCRSSFGEDAFRQMLVLQQGWS